MNLLFITLRLKTCCFLQHGIRLADVPGLIFEFGYIQNRID